MADKTRVTVSKSLAMSREEKGAIIGTKGYLLGKIFRFDSGKIIHIGRDDSQCDLIIQGDRVSRVHCWIFYDASRHQYIVCDLSTNGVVVDGKYKLTKRAEVVVQPGSTLLIGDTTNEIRLG